MPELKRPEEKPAITALEMRDKARLARLDKLGIFKETSLDELPEASKALLKNYEPLKKDFDLGTGMFSNVFLFRKRDMY